MDQKSIQKSMGKSMQKKIEFSMVLEFFGGGAPCPGHLRAGIVRPPKPNTTGTGHGLGLGQGQGLGHGQAQAQGQGQGHRASGQEHPLTPSRKARWRIRRPTGDERARFGHQKLSNPILMKCPNQMSFEFCLMNPSIILPTARTFRVGALLGAPLGLLARLLAEKIAFQEAFKKRSNFTSILTSIFVPLGSIFRPNLGAKIDQQSIKNRSKSRSKTRCKLGWILDGSWIDFWSILGPSWGPSWGQVGTKIRKNGVPNRCRKIIKKQVTRGAATKMRKFLAVPKESLRDPLN